MKKKPHGRGFRGNSALAASELSRNKQALNNATLTFRRSSRRVWLVAMQTLAEILITAAEGELWNTAARKLSGLLDLCAAWAHASQAVPDADATLLPMRSLIASTDPASRFAGVQRVRSALNRINSELDRGH